MLRIRIHMVFAPRACVEAASVLRSLIGPVRAKPGCSTTRFQMDFGDQCGLTWVEEWRTIEGFEQHLRSSAFRRILAVIELAAGPPEVEIDDVASRRGFELVEEILGLTPTERMESEAG